MPATLNSGSLTGFSGTLEIKASQTLSASEALEFTDNGTIPVDANGDPKPFLSVVECKVPGHHVVKSLQGDVSVTERYVAKILNNVAFALAGTINSDTTLNFRPHLTPRAGMPVDTIFALRGNWRKYSSTGTGNRTISLDTSKFQSPVYLYTAGAPENVEEYRVSIGEMFLSGDKYAPSKDTAIGANVVQSTVVVKPNWTLIEQPNGVLYPNSQVIIKPPVGTLPALPLARTHSPTFGADQPLTAVVRVPGLPKVPLKHLRPQPVLGVRYNINPPVYVGSTAGLVVGLTRASVTEDGDLRLLPSEHIEPVNAMITGDQSLLACVPAGTKLVVAGQSIGEGESRFTIADAIRAARPQRPRKDAKAATQKKESEN